MIEASDKLSLETLQQFIGVRLTKIAAQRYPGYLAYNQIAASFANGMTIRIDLCEKTIGSKFEVFVVRVRNGKYPIEITEWDHLEFVDFCVDRVFLLRRKEWVQTPIKIPHGLIGGNAVEQNFGAIDTAVDEENAVVVDSGLSIVSVQGAELSFNADTFPLVLQLRYEVASSPLPAHTKISLLEGSE